MFPVCIASLLFSYSTNSRKCVIKLSVSVSVSDSPRYRQFMLTINSVFNLFLEQVLARPLWQSVF